MRTLIGAYEDDKPARWKSMLKGHEYVFNPSDKMEFDAVKRVLFIAPELYSHAREHSDPELFDEQQCT